MTQIYLGDGEVWHKIERFDHFVKRWEKAKRRGQFFLVRYAGTDRYVNPNKINMVSEVEL